MKTTVFALFCCLAAFWYVQVEAVGDALTSDGIRRCRKPPVTGPCRALFTKYFWNPRTNSCETFGYGGCDGNDNRFKRDTECMKICGQMAQQPPCEPIALVPPPPGCVHFFYNDQTDGCTRVKVHCVGRTPSPTEQCPPVASIQLLSDCKKFDLRDPLGCPVVVVDCANRDEPGVGH